MSRAAVMLEVSLSLIVAFERVSVVVTIRRRRLLAAVPPCYYPYILKFLYFSVLVLGAEGEIDL